jgi:hypothetical protein
LSAKDRNFVTRYCTTGPFKSQKLRALIFNIMMMDCHII